MKRFVVVFLLTGSVAAFSQGRPSSHPGGPPSGLGNASGHGMSGSPRSTGHSGAERMPTTQQPLRQSQINSGAFRMLENKTGMTSQQLQDLYASSGAKNFGQFVSAVVVSKNLHLDTQKVLDGLKTASLGKTLQDLGEGKDEAKQAIHKANQEIKDASKRS